MKIVIYSANFAPEQIGIGKYSGEMAAWLAAKGHAVRVVAAPPYYPAWKVQQGYRWPPYRRQNYLGAVVWRAPIWVPKIPGGLKRILHLLSFALTSLPVMLRYVFWRPDVVLVVAPAFFCAPTAWLVARLSGAEAWLHIQDFEVDAAFELNLLKGKFLKRAVLALEKWVLRRFDRVSSISQRMVERLVLKGVKPERTYLFHNWVDTDRIRPLQSSSYRAELGIPQDSFVVLFSGSMSAKQGLAIIPAAARLLQDRPEIIFVICGTGVTKQVLVDESRGLPNVRFLPLQPFRRLGDLLCLADSHVLPQSPEAADLVMPSKLSGMLATGRPVIATCGSGTELESVVSQCGLVVPPLDHEALSRAVVRLFEDVPLRNRLGRAARVWAETNIEQNAVLSRAFGSWQAEDEWQLDEVVDQIAGDLKEMPGKLSKDSVSDVSSI